MALNDLNPDEGPRAAIEEDRRERMQRVRVGLTGLAVVLLIVVLATVVLGGINQQVDGSGNAMINAALARVPGDEPLADLGVAPGASENGAHASNGVHP